MCSVVIRWVDLMAKTVTSVSRKEEVIVEGHKMTGADYRYKVLKTLCDLPWPAETAISLLSVIKLVLLPLLTAFHVVYTLYIYTCCAYYMAKF